MAARSHRFLRSTSIPALCGYVLLLLSMEARSQSKIADSLRTLLPATSGTHRVDALNKLSFYLLNYDNKYFHQTADEAWKLSEKLGYEKGKAEVNILSGINEYTLGNKKLSDRYLRDGIRRSSATGERGLLGYGLVQVGINFHYSDQPDSSFHYLNSSFDVLKDSLHPYYLSRVYLAYADYFDLRGDRIQQLRYLTRCLRIRELLHDGTVSWLDVKIASYYTNQHDLEKATQYLNKAQRSLGRDTLDNETISEIQAQRAIVCFKYGKFQKALNLFMSARKFYEKNSRKQELSNMLLNIGLVFDSMDNYDLSLRHYFDALNIADFNHFPLETIRLESAISWSYLRLGQFDLSSRYALRSLTHARTNHHPSDVAAALNLLGMLKGNQQKSREALTDLKQALAIRIRLQDNPGTATTLFNIGTLYEKENKLDSSVVYQKRSLAIREQGKNEEAIADSWQVMGRLYVKLGNYRLAESYLDKAEKLARKIHVSYILLNTYETHRQLLKTEFKFEKALEYSVLYETLRDSIFTTHLSSRLSILENIYRLQEKEQEIQLLNQQQKLQQDNLLLQSAEIRQQRLLMAFIVGILLLVCAISIFVFRYYRRVKTLNLEITHRNDEIQLQARELKNSNTELGRLNNEILIQKQEILLQTEQLASRNEIINGINQTLEQRIQTRTAELKQAYRELDTFFYRASHDFRRPLTTFMGLAEVAKITIHDTAALELFDKVNDTARSLDKMLFKLQSISDVGSQELLCKEVCLQTIFELESDKFRPEIQRGHVDVLISGHDVRPFLSYPTLIQIIVSNLLENSISFSNKAQPHVWLNAFENANEIVLEVKDDGEGIAAVYSDRVFDMYFRASDRSRGNGLGLYIVKKTVQKLNGRLEMVSEPEKGTAVRVYLPKTN